MRCCFCFGPIPYAFDSPYSNEVIRLWGGTFITLQNVIIVVVSALTIALLYAFMKLTFMGKALRAVAQDRETAGLMGINPDQLIMLTFVIASALAGMGGAMLGPILVLTPFAGTSVIVKAFAIVIIGGFGNVEGTIIAGLLVGLIESRHDPAPQSRIDRHRRLHAAAPDARRASDRAHRRKARRECLAQMIGRLPRRSVGSWISRRAWFLLSPLPSSRSCRSSFRIPIGART